MLKDAERKLLKLLLKDVNKILNDANKKFDEQVKVSYPYSFSERKKACTTEEFKTQEKFGGKTS